MICQFKGHDICTQCERCKGEIFFNLINANKLSRIQFNFISVVNQKTVKGEFVFISESIINAFVKKYEISAEIPHKIGGNTFIYLLGKDTDLLDLVLEKSRVEFDENKSVNVASLETLEKFLDIDKTNQANNKLSTDSEKNQKKCTSAKVVKVQLQKSHFKFIMNRTFPDKIQIVLIKPNSCPKESVALSDFLFSSKSVCLIIFWSILENVVFSFLNQIDILGLVFYVWRQEDAVVSSIISKLSKFECLTTYSYGSNMNSFLSNKQVLDVFGVNTGNTNPKEGKTNKIH